jgi:hypothetical protein
MANLKVDTKNFFEKFSANLKKQIGLLFWLLFLFILIYEFFVARQALQEVLWTEVKPPPVKTASDTKLNFADYELVVKSINEAKNYTPEPKILKNPFKPMQ